MDPWGKGLPDRSVQRRSVRKRHDGSLMTELQSKSRAVLGGEKDREGEASGHRQGDLTQEKAFKPPGDEANFTRVFVRLLNCCVEDDLE